MKPCRYEKEVIKGWGVFGQYDANSMTVHVYDTEAMARKAWGRIAQIVEIEIKKVKENR